MSRWPSLNSRCQTAQCCSFPRRVAASGFVRRFAGAFTLRPPAEPTRLCRRRPSRLQQFRPPDEGWMERRQTHSFFRSRLRRATTLSRGDRDLSRRSTVAVFGCGPTLASLGRGTGAAATARAKRKAWRSGAGPPCVAVRAATGDATPCSVLQDRLRKTPLHERGWNLCTINSLRSQ